MKTKFRKAIVPLSLALTLATGILVPAKTEAGLFNSVGVIGSIVSTGIQAGAVYMQLEKQINYIENEGRDAFYEQLQSKHGVNYDSEANAILDDVMYNLSPVIAEYDPTIKQKPYNYFVNKNNSFNAFCTLGHNLSVNIGLFTALNYNTDEIAFVLGHELAHGTHRDPANGVKKQLGLQAITSILASGTGVAGNLGAAVINNMGRAKGITLPMEKRADKDAFVYCSEAGYNVGAGAAVWQRIIDKNQGKTTSSNALAQFFNPSDHPGHVSRRDTYNKTINEYSNKMVKVDANTATVYLNNKAIGVPAPAFGMSARERAFFIAGDMASVYHANAKAKPTAYMQGNTVYLGEKSIMTITSNDNGNTWVNNINKAYKK